MSGLGQAVAGACVLVLGRQGLQGEGLVSLAGPDGNTVGDRPAEDLRQAIVIVGIEDEADTRAANRASA